MRAHGAALAVGILALTAPVHAANSEPITVVRTFLAAVLNDRDAAQSMLTKDAGFGAGDVGGPFQFAVLDEFSKNCRFDTSAPTTKLLGMEGRNIVTVEVTLVCQAGGSHSNTLPANFMVEGDKIAGLYLNVRSGLDEAASGGTK